MTLQREGIALSDEYKIILRDDLNSLGLTATELSGDAKSQLDDVIVKPLANKPKKIMLRGDSTMIGYLTGYPSGNANAQLSAPPRRLRDAIRARGFDCEDNFYAGTGGYSSANGFSAFDPRITIGAGWVYNSAQTAMLGVLRNSTDTTSVLFTPPENTDTAVFYWSGSLGKGVATFEFGGVSKTVDQNRATVGWYSTTIGPADGVTMGNNIAKVTRVSSGVTADAVWCYDSTKPSFQILNGAGSGMQSKNLANSGTLDRPLYFPNAVLSSGDLLVWALGPNDWRNDSDSTPESFLGYAQEVYEQCVAKGVNMIIIAPLPTSTEAASLERQETWRAVSRNFAASEGLLFFDLTDRYGSYVDANAKGLMVGGSDYFHGNWYYAMDYGNMLADIILNK